MIDINKLDKGILEPAVCQDADDFYKMCYSTVALSEEMPKEALSAGMTALFHDYLALVLKGELEPYEIKMSDSAVDRSRSAILAVTEHLAESGIPLKEVNGKMKIDIPAALEEARRNDD